MLGEAAHTDDPAKAKELRDKATKTFLAAAEVLDDAEVTFQRAGYADLKNDKFIEADITAGMAEFDQGYKYLAAAYGA